MGKELALVRRLIQHYHTNDPFELCKEMGYAVYRVPLTGVRGFYQYALRKHIIYLSDELGERQERFVCAHELGHSLLHRKTHTLDMDACTYLKTSFYEKEADHFAACLLLPDDERLEEFEGWSAGQLASYFGLSEELVVYRLGERCPSLQKQRRF